MEVADERDLRRRYRQAHGFFRALLGDCRDEAGQLSASLVIWDRRQYRAYWTDRIEVAAAIAIVIGTGGRDADFHLALHDRDERLRLAKEKGMTPIGEFLGAIVTTFRGLIITAAVLVGFWVDIDYGRVGHEKEHLPPDRDAAMRIVEALEECLGTPVSLVVDSGGGLHVYILLREPWQLESDEDRARATALCEAVQRRCGVLAAEIGRERDGRAWEVDATADFARVLRVPGTWNFKTSSPRDVRIVKQTQVRWNPSDLEEHPALAALIDPPGKRVAARGEEKVRVHRPRTDELDRVRIKLARELKACPKLRRAWRHQRDDEIASRQQRAGRSVDTSMSVYDFHIALLASERGWNEQEIAGLLHLHQLRWERDPAAKRTDYYDRTIGKARRPTIEERFPAAPPAPEPTRPIVRTKADLDVVSEIVEEWVPGTTSVSFCGWPGLGKTSRASRVCARKLAEEAQGFEEGVAALALPTRELVGEKVAELAKTHPEIVVLPFLGRSPDQESGWWCERTRVHRLRSELQRSGCSGCASLDLCREYRGRYLFEQARVLAAIGDSATRVLVVTTHDLLRFSWDKLPEDTPIILDDAGPRFGLVDDITIRHEDLCSARDNIDVWMREQLEDQDLTLEDLRHQPVNKRVRYIATADVARHVIDAIVGLHARWQRVDRLAARIAEIPAVYRDAIAKEQLRPRARSNKDPWPWEEIQPEDGGDLRPAFTDFALKVVQTVIGGSSPLAFRTGKKARDRGEPEYHVLLPDTDLIERARAGNVMWLGVGPMPSQVLDALGARQEVVVAQPDKLTVEVGLVPTEWGPTSASYLSFGPTRANDPPVADEITRAMARGLSPRPDFGAVVHKADWEALGQPDGIGYYGRDHAATNSLAHCDLLLVRRHSPPLDAIMLDAEALRRALRIPRDLVDGAGPASWDDATHGERRRWAGSTTEIVTMALRDPFEREVQRYHELHHQLNAVGRCRPLTSTEPCRVILLAGRPFDWVTPVLRPLKDIAAELGVELDLPDPEARSKQLAAQAARKRQEAWERQERIATTLETEPHISQRELARQLGVGQATIARDLSHVAAWRGAEGVTLNHPSLYRSIKGRVNQTDPLRGLPTLKDVRAEGESAHPGVYSAETVRRRWRELRKALDAGVDQFVPKRSDAAKSQQAVLEAVWRLVAPGDEPDGGAMWL